MITNHQLLSLPNDCFKKQKNCEAVFPYLQQFSNKITKKIETAKSSLEFLFDWDAVWEGWGQQNVNEHYCFISFNFIVLLLFSIQFSVRLCFYCILLIFYFAFFCSRENVRFVSRFWLLFCFSFNYRKLKLKMYRSRIKAGIC